MGPHDLASQLPDGFAKWVRTPPPLAQKPDVQLRAVLRRVPRKRLHCCMRRGCSMACTWGLKHCCSRCEHEDPGSEQEWVQEIEHGWRCDELQLGDASSVWLGPKEEQDSHA